MTDARKPLFDNVDALENKVAVYEAHFKELDGKIDGFEYKCEVKMDDIEQCDRLSCIRLNGLPLQEGD